MAMQSKRILLSIHPQLFETLKAKAEKNSMTVQEAIIDAIRQTTAPAAPAKKSNAGRPKKVDDKFLEYFSRER